MIGFTALRRLAAAPAPRDVTERCELCSAELAPGHRHVVDLTDRAIQCACQACAILFERGARFRTVPSRIVSDEGFALTAAEWTALGIPVGLAFCFWSSQLGRPIVCYPGAAGVVEGELAPGGWDAILQRSPLAAALEPDVEALLFRGQRGSSTVACFVIPIDLAYSLAGRLRATWRGFSGGDEAQRELDAFFADLAQRSRPLGGAR